ncbi:hypothetical protein Taro_014198 [Colocasia esculenta]|uniref:Pentatricopeptide repeat-containing protein n=1 Tax=Colocasia esculenta TaxID=4460 RepID=A0A843U8H2_COLES|nr:hypothetical protein [Colocasia esculenta]
MFQTLVLQLCREKKAAEARQLLDGMPDWGWRTQNMVSYNILLKGLCRTGETLMALALLGLMMKRGGCCEPDVVTYTTIIGGLFEEGRAKDALLLIDDMRAAGISPDVVTYSVLVKGFVSAGNTDVALRFLGDIVAQKDGCKPNVFTYSIAINSLCEIGSVEEAFSLINEMKNAGIYPNIVTYNTLIKGLCKSARLILALQLFEDMNMQACYLKPNVVTYNTLINYLCTEGYVDAAGKLFGQMHVRGISPNVITYSTLIKGYCKVGNFSMARMLLGEMEKQDDCCKPNVVTYSTMIDGFCEGCCIDDAISLLRKMHARDISPNVITYTSIIKGMCKVGDIEMAFWCLEEMVGWDNLCKPDVVTYSILVDSLCNQGYIDDAFWLIGEMKAKNIHPDVVTYNSFIKGLCLIGESDEALKMAEEMVEQGCVPNVVTYTMIIEKLHEAGRICDCDCMRLLAEMLDRNIAPDFIMLRMGFAPAHSPPVAVAALSRRRPFAAVVIPATVTSVGAPPLHPPLLRLWPPRVSSSPVTPCPPSPVRYTPTPSPVVAALPAFLDHNFRRSPGSHAHTMGLREANSSYLARSFCSSSGRWTASVAYSRALLSCSLELAHCLLQLLNYKPDPVEGLIEGLSQLERLTQPQKEKVVVFQLGHLLDFS